MTQTTQYSERDRAIQQAMKLLMDITSALRQNPSAKRVQVLVAKARDLIVHLEKLQ